eukprot:UN28712
MGCLYLATKTEEEKRRHRDVLNVFDRLLTRNTRSSPVVLDPYGKRYQRWKRRLLEMELLLLKELGYHLDVVHPQKFILQFVLTLECEEIAQKAWAFLNDSYRIPYILEFKPAVVACAAIFLAARVCGTKLPDNPPWWELFGTTYSELHKVAQMMHELYSLPKSKHLISFEKQAKEEIERNEK